MKVATFILTLLILTSCQVRNSWECQGDCINGNGIKKWKDGGIEKGMWKDVEMVGHGYQYFGKSSEFAGDSYEGEFLKDYNGFGKYLDVSEGATYIVYWNNGKSDGKGKLTFGANSKHPNEYYDGDWRNGLHYGLRKSMFLILRPTACNQLFFIKLRKSSEIFNDII